MVRAVVGGVGGGRVGSMSYSSGRRSIRSGRRRRRSSSSSGRRRRSS